jgi:hypothetical protein
MKIKFAFLIFLVLSVALGVTLFVTHRKATEQHESDVKTILYHSNQWQQAVAKWDDEKQTNARLNNDLDTQKKAYADLTNGFSLVSANLTKTEATLQTTIQQDKEEIARRNAKIAELESQNAALDQRAVDLSTAITNLTTQIEDTKRRLAASEGDKAVLEKELKRLMAEKAELERQFSDLAILRAQVAKLKEELNISRRLDWIRKGLFSPGEQKGAQQLMQGANAPGARPQAPARYDLNVEVNADGSVRVIPPLTNRPAGTNAPP